MAPFDRLTALPFKVPPMIGLVLQLLLLAQSPSVPETNAIDVLKAAKNAVIGAQSVSYVVIRDYTDSSGKKTGDTPTF